MSKPPVSDVFTKATGRIKETVFEQQMLAKSIATGNLTDEQTSGILALVQAGLLSQHKSGVNAQNRTHQDLLFIALIQNIENLSLEIADMEARFKDKYGDAWREELALKILDKDDPEMMAYAQWAQKIYNLHIVHRC